MQPDHAPVRVLEQRLEREQLLCMAERGGGVVQVMGHAIGQRQRRAALHRIGADLVAHGVAAARRQKGPSLHPAKGTSGSVRAATARFGPRV
jgi:hypothetical protein